MSEIIEARRLLLESEIEEIKTQLFTATVDTKKELSQKLISLFLALRSVVHDPRAVPINLQNITNIYLSDAALDGADLRYAILSGLNLTDANLEGANLTDANLTGANLTNANLGNANLTNANLGNANLTGANLGNANLERVGLERANLEGANLERANLEGAYLEGANLTGANLTGANLTITTLTDANLTDANLMGADLEDANLMGADLTDANLRNAILRYADLERANLTGADLIGADFTGANLTDADLTGAILEPTAPTAPMHGIAFEVHTAFTTFEPKEPNYLGLINQPDFEGDIYEFIRNKFTENITTLFPHDAKKLVDFNTAFTKMGKSIPDTNKQLIAKSISFAFEQDDNFKQQYIISYLDETCKAYAGPGDNMSCVKGIIERFVLCVGSAVEIVCKDGCENETYKELDKLMNPKFDIQAAASSWWENEAIKRDVIRMDEEGRKANFIQYLMNEAKKVGSYNEIVRREISDYSDDINYAFAKLVLGGKKPRKTRKSRKTMKSRKAKKSRKSKKAKKSRKLENQKKSSKSRRLKR